MARPKKDGEKVCLNIDRPTIERLRAHADEMGQTMTVAIERAINGYLDRIEENRTSE